MDAAFFLQFRPEAIFTKLSKSLNRFKKLLA